MGRKEEDDNNGGGEMASSFLDGTGLVCVTGGTGFVASWLIMRLLQRGYSVHATVWTNPGSSVCLAGMYVYSIIFHCFLLRSVLSSKWLKF